MSTAAQYNGLNLVNGSVKYAGMGKDVSVMGKSLQSANPMQLTKLTSAAWVVSRAPRLANVFSLNSGGRAAAAALDRAANGYLATIRGSGWAARSFDVARQFTGVEQVLSAGGNRAPIPV